MVTVFFLPVSFWTKTLLIFLWCAVNGVSLYSLARVRKSEINGIALIIKGIRSAAITAEEEVKLPLGLKGLEEEIRQMFRKLNSDIIYLKRLEQMRTEFLGNVSHELKTPLFTIQGYLETLERGAINDPGVNVSFLKKAIYHTTLLSNLVHDLIDISHIESGEMRMSFRYFDLTDFAQNIIQEFNARAEEKGLKLEVVADKTKLEVLGDKNRLRQVFVNLIDNALKYTDTGSITIKLADEKKMVCVSVIDTGIGLTEAEQARVFERFYRVDKARSREAGGTGLGLAIVKHIIEAHHSKVELISEAGKGSVFTFRLKKY